jgi:hypothetical protein
MAARPAVAQAKRYDPDEYGELQEAAMKAAAEGAEFRIGLRDWRRSIEEE